MSPGGRGRTDPRPAGAGDADPETRTDADPETGTDAEAAARALCQAGRELHRLRLVAGRAGNLSVRLRDGSLLITPRGSHKGRLRPERLVRLEPGKPTASAVGRASTELPFHRAAYEADPTVGAVIHVHAPALTAAGLRDLDLAAQLPEVAEAVGGTALVPFEPSASEALARAVARAVSEGAAVLLLRRHGAVVVGPDLREAMYRAELAELSAFGLLLAEATALETDLDHLVALHRSVASRAGGAVRHLHDPPTA